MGNLILNILYISLKSHVFSIDCHIASLYYTKTTKKIIKVYSKSSNLSSDSFKNIDFIGIYKQSKIIGKETRKITINF